MLGVPSPMGYYSQTITRPLPMSSPQLASFQLPQGSTWMQPLPMAQGNTMMQPFSPAQSSLPIFGGLPQTSPMNFGNSPLGLSTFGSTSAGLGSSFQPASFAPMSQSPYGDNNNLMILLMCILLKDAQDKKKAEPVKTVVVQNLQPTVTDEPEPTVAGDSPVDVQEHAQQVLDIFKRFSDNLKAGQGSGGLGLLDGSFTNFLGELKDNLGDDAGDLDDLIGRIGNGGLLGGKLGGLLGGGGGGGLLSGLKDKLGSGGGGGLLGGKLSGLLGGGSGGGLLSGLKGKLGSGGGGGLLGGLLNR